MPKLISSQVNNCFRQERDWTCAIACIRTILSSYPIEVESEEGMLLRLKDNITVGPQSSEDIRNKNIIPSNLNPVFRDDFIEVPSLEELLEDYNIMIETMHNGGHWVVLINIYEDSEGKSYVTMYDPYYDILRIENLNQVNNMWKDYKLLNKEKEFVGIPKYVL